MTEKGSILKGMNIKGAKEQPKPVAQTETNLSVSQHKPEENKYQQFTRDDNDIKNKILWKNRK